MLAETMPTQVALAQATLAQTTLAQDPLVQSPPNPTQAPLAHLLAQAPLAPPT